MSKIARAQSKALSQKAKDKIKQSRTKTEKLGKRIYVQLLIFYIGILHYIFPMNIC